MFPVLVELFGFPIHSYGVLLGVAFLAGLFTATALGKTAGLKPDDLSDLALVCLVTGLVGARLLFVAVEWDQFRGDPTSIILRRDGFVFYGGLLLAIPCAIGFAKKRGLDLRTAADVMAPSLALAHAIGRLGCFAQGCCYGGPSNFGLLFDPQSPPSLHFGDVAVHPTQLYESILLVALFGWLVSRFRRRRFAGELIVHYAAGYAAMRFLIEFLRADDRGFYAGPFSVSQIISLAVLGVAGGLLVKWRKTAISK